MSDTAGFDALETSWKALLERTERPSLFMSYDWHRIWWRHYARRVDRLHILTVHEHGRLVALLPLYRSPGTVYRGAGLQLLGTGGSRADEVATEYSDVLLDAGGDTAARAARLEPLLDHLCSFSNWKRVELRCLLDDALMLQLARDRWSPARRLELSAGQRYRVPLADGESGHLSRLAGGRARRLARSRRAAARDGGLVREVLDAPDAIDTGFAELAALSEERQETLSRRSVFASPRFTAFHRELAASWAAAGHTRLVRFRLDGRTLAMLQLFKCRDSLHYYQSGFASAQANRYMPLTLAHLQEMEVAREERLAHYDLMRGEPPCYKDDFGCETTPLWNAYLFASTGSRERFRLRRRARARLVRVLARLNIRRR